MHPKNKVIVESLSRKWKKKLKQLSSKKERQKAKKDINKS